MELKANQLFAEVFGSAPQGMVIDITNAWLFDNAVWQMGIREEIGMPYFGNETIYLEIPLANGKLLTFQASTSGSFSLIRLVAMLEWLQSHRISVQQLIG